MKKVVLIANPTAYRATVRKIDRAVDFLRDNGLIVELLLTSKKGDAEEFARKAASGGEASFLIAAGGDGTFNETANGVAGTGMPVAVLPLGTTNVIAKELGIPEDIEGALRVAVKNRVKSVSLGKIVLSSGKSRYFSMMAGVGYDATTVKGLNPVFKKIYGAGAHVASGLKTLLKWKPERLLFSIDGRRFEGYSAILLKAKKYAGNYVVAPDADMSDPSLYVFIMHGKRRLDIIKYVSAILAGRHLMLKDVTYLKAQAIGIEGRAPVQLDGDYEGETPASVSVVPDALKLIY